MADDFAKEVRELFSQAESADKTNRDEALKDLEFAAGEHWDSQVRQYRESIGIEKYGFPLPCLTINTIPQFIGQVIGDRRANSTSIKVLPREDGDKEVAQVRSELIRGIELQSKAPRVYSMAFEQAVTCGQGHLRVDMEYARDDAFDRDLFINAIPNPMAVLWDPLSGDPTGRDAKHCFVADKITESEYKKRFPKAARVELFDANLKEAGWCKDNSVRIAEYHEMFEKPRTIAMMQDGSVQDVTDKPREEWLPLVAVGPNGPVIREKAMCKYARTTLTNGQEPLEDPFEIKLHRLPIIRCMGREVWIGDKRVRFGLVRFARDPSMLKDYTRSVIAELLMLAPRANHLAEARAIEGREADWKNVLVYNDGSQAPTEITQNNIAALMKEALNYSQDMKDVTGIQDASLGIKSNETSGVAIQRRQNEGDIATIIYHDNMNQAQQEVGEVLNALIPICFDTARTIRTLGADDSAKLVRVNDPNHPESVDLGLGKYDVTVTTGPSYQTRRVESTQQLMDITAKAPQIAQAAGDLIIGEMDLIRGDEIAERIKRTIPANILGDEADEDQDPEAVQQKQQAAEKQQMIEELQFRGVQADTELKEAQAQKAQAEAAKAKAEALALLHGGDEGPDPIAQGKLSIDWYKAQTDRAKVAGPIDLPPEAIAAMAPAIANAIVEALQGHSLPGALQAQIGAAAHDAAVNENIKAEEAHQQAMQPDPEPPAAA